jgi:NCS1 family nucleobase:cation symporter-1
MEERIQEEGVFGTYPLLKHEREWNLLDFCRVNIGLAIATWAFLIGGTIALFVGVQLGVTAIVIGNVIGVGIMSLSICISTGKYGIEQYTLLRSVFGYNGVRMMVLIALLVFGLGWASVLSIMFGRAATNIVNIAFSEDFGDSGIVVSLFGLVAIAISWYILWRGPDSLNSLNKYLAPGLIILSCVMVGLVFVANSFTDIVNSKPINPLNASVLVNFATAVELNIAAGLGWWPIMGSLSRLTRTPRAALWPNMVGVFAAAVLGEIVGLLTALSLGSFDPTVWMVPLGGIAFGIIALIFVAMANVTSIIAFFYSLCVAIRQVGLANKMKWSILTIVLFIPVMIAVFFPDAIYDNFFKFLAWTALIFAPLAGITLTDFLMRKRKIYERPLYLENQDSMYAFWKGFNPAAFVAIIIGAIVYYLLLNPLTLVSSTSFQFIGASVPSCIAASLIYFLLTKFIVKPTGRGGYTTGDHNFDEDYIAYKTLGDHSFSEELERRLQIIESGNYEDPAREDLPTLEIWFFIGVSVMIGVVAFILGYLV